MNLKLNLDTAPHVIRFYDGATVKLHQVIVQGVADMFLRACDMEDGTFAIFDMRSVDGNIGNEIRAAHRHDVPGIVYSTLRLKYTSAASFVSHLRLMLARETLEKEAA